MNVAESELDHRQLTTDILYDPTSGIFSWKVKPSKNRQAGEIIGGKPSKQGYLRARYKKKLFFQHRLAWFYYYGVWPKVSVDHINGDKTDNRIDNLREATHSDNKANIPLKRNNKSGYKGVSWSTRDRHYLVQISKEGKTFTVGYFKDKTEAADAYDKAALEYFGEYALTNKMIRERELESGRSD